MSRIIAIALICAIVYGIASFAMTARASFESVAVHRAAACEAAIR